MTSYSFVPADISISEWRAQVSVYFGCTSFKNVFSINPGKGMHGILWFDSSHNAVITKCFKYLNVLESHFLQH